MKIETYFIPPIKHLNLSLEGDRLFALAHFILEGNQPYIDFFKSQKDKWITLDSGVAEGHRVPIETFMNCAKEINANEIICPDELWDGPKTLELTKEFLKNISDEDKKRFKFMMVPQGKTKEEWVKCLLELQELPECSCIGLSKFDAPTIFGTEKDIHKVCSSRKKMVMFLILNKLIKKPVHLLGYDNPAEFKYYLRFKEDCKFIRSCDSASAILYAINGVKFNKNCIKLPPKFPGGDTYHIKEMNEQQLADAQHNIKIVKSMCND